MRTLHAQGCLILFTFLTLVVQTSLSGSEARAQSGTPGGPLGSARLTTGFRSWLLRQDSGRTQTVSQFYLPLNATVRLGRKSDVVISSEAAWASYGPKGKATASLNGTSDVGIQAIHAFPSRRLFLLGGVSIPSGTQKLSARELEVARVLGNPLLGFHLKEYGQGLDFNLGATASLPLAGPWKLGMGLGYVLHGSYVLSAEGERFRPTPEGTASVGLQIAGARLGEAVGSSECFAVYRVLAKDKLGSSTILDEGNELVLQAQGDIRWTGWRTFGFARLLLKGHDKVFSGSGDQVQTADRRAGTGVLARLGVEKPLSPKFRTRINGEWYHFGGSENPIDNGNTYGFGPGLKISAAEGMQLDIVLLYLVGSVEPVGRASDIRLRGYALSLTVMRVSAL